MQAHRFEAAFEMMGEVVERLKDRGDTLTALSLLDRRKEAADQFGLPEGDRRRARDWWIRGTCRLCSANTNSPSNAPDGHCTWRVATVGEARRAARWWCAAASCWRPPTSTRPCSSSETLAANSKAQLIPAGWPGRASAAGVAPLRRGESQRARRDLEEATCLTRAAGDDYLRSQSLTQTGYAWTTEGQFDRAETCLREAHDIATRIGSRLAQANAARHLGEVACFRQDWSAGRRWYEEAFEASLAAQPFGRHYDRANLGLLELAAQNFSRGREILSDLRATFLETGREHLMPLIDLALSACAAGIGRRDEFAEHLARFDADPGLQEVDRPDAHRIAVQAASLADEQGWPQARRLHKLAEKLSDPNSI